MSASSHGFPNAACLSHCPAPAAAPGMVSDLTVTWFESIITGVLEPEAASALPEDPGRPWKLSQNQQQGPLPHLCPRRRRCLPVEEWRLRDQHHAVPPSTLSSPPTIPLTNRFDVLSKKDFPPLGKNAQQQQAAKPSSVHHKLLKEAVARRSSGGNTNPVTTGPSVAGEGASLDYRAPRCHPWSHPVPIPLRSVSMRAWPRSPPFSRALDRGLPHLKAILKTWAGKAQRGRSTPFPGS
ncbi:uncharacterized protein LOC121521383 [Xyrichtys novacula]|uniref:Uncharacterized protein LOC121521383 n=1 Tax=Xyrichtys novacula TaxID=13765 RepID=A0AAV1F904_XYRNO|nr:uncharacterized protein LOC121521383 [Xyrichtys novacula]